MTKLTEEQKELLKNWEKDFWNKYNIAYVRPKGFATLGTEIIEDIEKILVAKDLEAEQKVKEAVRKERERCIDDLLIAQAQISKEQQKFKLDYCAKLALGVLERDPTMAAPRVAYSVLETIYEILNNEENISEKL